ncbi:hypothetical protein [Methylobacterium symbioticum]|uniref:Helix-turn-helix domain-containing protein n=1 Tax=Methylobacterium symbioticum TaxID=2584084 RepID=A0A509EBW7_9HYPH|nr:hypothetical protein [Methylobacterium symbioticum]VUD70653.1 hypothetical protein MET9862_01225 [Methylobacterium symbioticum]
MQPTIPAPLAAAFEKQVTISAAELCALLPMDRKTLGRHIRFGHIEFVQMGFGDKAMRRGFTLEAVMRFIRERSATECQSISARARMPTASTSGAVGGGFLAQLSKRNAELRKR